MFDINNLGHLNRPEHEAPNAMAAFWAMGKAAFANGQLSGMHKQLVAVAVALTTQCPYCIKLHTQAARAAGASDAHLSEVTLVTAALRVGGAVTHATQIFAEGRMRLENRCA